MAVQNNFFYEPVELCVAVNWYSRKVMIFVAVLEYVMSENHYSNKCHRSYSVFFCWTNSATLSTQEIKERKSCLSSFPMLRKENVISCNRWFITSELILCISKTTTSEVAGTVMLTHYKEDPSFSFLRTHYRPKHGISQAQYCAYYWLVINYLSNETILWFFSVRHTFTLSLY